MLLAIDIETFSDISLPDCGVYRYVDSPSFKILLFAYAIDEDPVQIIDIASGEKIPKAIEKAIFDKAVTKTAFNAQFERVCLSKHFGKHIEPESWSCTMVKALTLGIAGNLDSVSKTLGFPIDKQKLFTGKNLIRLFSIPRKVQKNDDAQMSFLGEKTRLLPSDKPEEWQQFKEYCIQDVVVERKIRKKLESFQTSEDEMKIWYLDQKINDYGVMLDQDFVKQAIDIDARYAQQLMDRYREVTGLDNPKSVAELKKWLEPRLGFEVKAVTKETMPELLKAAKDLPEVKEALKIRQETAKTSVSKYTKMEDVICSDKRARGLLQFYGANRTGRWAGRLIQVQNLPQNKISDLDTARQIVRSGDLELLEMVYDKVPFILSQLIRTAFIPSEGHRFIVADFSAIEARVIAWMAGEAWRMEVFKTHGKIYEASAAQMFKVPIESIHKGSPLRQKGKVAELALGYQGAAGALIQMGALKMGLTEEELPELVSQWRAANTKITKFWYDVENAAIEAVSDRTTVEIQKGIKFIYQPGILFIQLPSGRRLAYLRPKVEKHDKFVGKVKLTFEGLDENYNWVREDTYGGKLVENIVQATARDCLRDAMLRLDEADYHIAFHVHDEVILDEEIDTGSLDEVTAIMGKPITWAPDLPLRADGYECTYYMKD
jgi:DNA polymerase